MTKEEKKAEIISNIDRVIHELVYEKTQLIKAYNYYHGKRDPEQFRHLEENYGIGTPTSVEFIPLVRKHVDVLIGEYLSTPLLPKISCKDTETLSSAHRQLQLKINNEILDELKSQLNNSLYNAIQGQAAGQQDQTDKEIEEAIQRVIDATERNFISDFEVAGQNIIDWSLQSRIIDFLNKRKILLTDLLISGTSYYKVIKSPSKELVDLVIRNPLHTFIDRNPEVPYLNKSSRSVCRDYLTKDQILAKYWKDLTKEDLEELEVLQDFGMEGGTVYLRSFDTVTGNPSSDGILGGFEVTPLMPFERNSSQHFRLFPVYEVEWLKTEKEGDKYVTNRYEGVRIGTNIYIPIGKVDEVFRSRENPEDCALTVNGLFYGDRNGDPLSLMLSTANLQDKFDVLNFYRDNVIAESGTVGDWIDLAYIPKVLGATLAEKLMKWKAYKKQGLALIDSSQEGLPPMNTTFGGYDDTIKLNTIQAIDLAIQRVEDTCSTITGVFREKLGGIEQKDAVTNVQLGVRQSAYITKQYYQIMDLLTREMLLDILNLTKIVFKNGFSGTIILGDRLNKIFTALPEHYTVTDYDIHIADSAEVIREQELIKQLVIEFIKAKEVDPTIIMEAMTATGLTKMKIAVNEALDKRKKEANEIGKLQQQVQELDQQLKQAGGEAQKLQKQVEGLNQEKVQLEKERLKFEKELEWYKARVQNEYNDKKIELDLKRVQLEALQLYDNNPNNDEIRNS